MGDTSASSTSEMITTLFEYGKTQKNWTLPVASARLLFAGIVGDTGRFMFPSATVKTFDMASKLIKYEFSREDLFAGMYEVDRKILHLQGYIFQNFEIEKTGPLLSSLIKRYLKNLMLLRLRHHNLVVHLGEVKGIRAWAILIEEEKQIRVRLRSKGPIINTLAAQYNGGGHPLASGALVYSWEEAEELIGKLQQLCE